MFDKKFETIHVDDLDEIINDIEINVNILFFNLSCNFWVYALETAAIKLKLAIIIENCSAPTFNSVSKLLLYVVIIFINA